jgi:ubiquinone/menaquinone biosynthesis C-methylase UbiE
MTSVRELYELWADDENPLELELQHTLDPRGTDSLFAAFAALGPQRGQLVADVGARDALHTIRLVREHGLRALALDPLPLHVERARQAVAEAGLDGEIDVVQARIEAIPLPDASTDWIWCRDVLVHVELGRGFAECARVLRADGHMLVYVTCATERLEPHEANELFESVAVVPESAQPRAIEQHAVKAGLTLVSKTELRGEWRERMIEDGTWSPADDLLRLSRLRRREAELRERHGASRVAAYAGGLLWGIYQLLGKLSPTVYVWRRDA